jgi:glycosyltransferase involved in cell wall biosynthesis
MGPLVTIMIATYNQPEYIDQAVKSALLQDYDNLEVIISDDSINDDTTNILTSYHSNPRFTYYKNDKNIGRVANYRKLLYEYAKGDWVLMLDGDDYYKDYSYVSKAINVALTDPEIVFVGACHEIYDEAKNEAKETKIKGSNIIIDGKDFFIKGLALPQHSTILYLRKLSCSIDFYRHASAGSDSESLFRLLLHGKVAYLPDVVSVWRIHDLNFTYNRDIKTQIRDIQFIDSVYQYAKQFIDIAILKKWRFDFYKSMSYNIVDYGEKSGKLVNVFKALVWAHKYWGIKDTLNYLKRYIYLNVISANLKMKKGLGISLKSDIIAAEKQ